MKKILIKKEQAREQLLEGATLLYEAVSTTLGPLGLNVIIGAYGEPIVTHDGVTVAKSIEEVEGASPGAQIGIEMIKSSSSKTNDNVGDGTTSSTILAYELISKGMKSSKNAMALRRELDEAAKKAEKILDRLATPVVTEQEAIEIATISSEDKTIGKKVGSMYHTLGKNGMVIVEIGEKVETGYEIAEGYSFDRGLLSNMQITDGRTQTTTVKNPAILVVHGVPSFQDVEPLFKEAYANGKESMVIIARDLKKELLDEVLARTTDEEFQVFAIKAPGFGENQIELLRDIAAVVGTEAVGDKLPKKVSNLTFKDLGTAEEVVVTPNETVITGGSDVTEYIEDLNNKLGKMSGEHDKSKVEARIAQLNAKVGHIKVGGNTEMEAEERKYLIDDAVAATEAALKDGWVPGGGTTYIEIAKQLDDSTEGERLLKEALEGPFKVLMSNAGEKYGVKLSELTEFGKGFDILGDGTLVDLKEHGIIDPAKVIRQAITNATSVAGSVLTTGHIVANKREKDDGKDEDE